MEYRKTGNVEDRSDNVLCSSSEKKVANASINFCEFNYFAKYMKNDFDRPK